jgi:hypothetical protein
MYSSLMTIVFWGYRLREAGRKLPPWRQHAQARLRGGLLTTSGTRPLSALQELRVLWTLIPVPPSSLAFLTHRSFELQARCWLFTALKSLVSSATSLWHKRGHCWCAMMAAGERPPWGTSQPLVADSVATLWKFKVPNWKLPPALVKDSG